MNTGELLTRATIWGALLFYAWGAALLALSGNGRAKTQAARMAWTFGCLFFVAHVLAAFGFYHHWSHVAAYVETARQTEEMTGFRSGAGLYLNYAFGFIWSVLVLWWWLAPAKFLAQTKWHLELWNAFAVFMIFNGTVVFGKGAVRWFGSAICAGLAFLWWRQWRRRAIASPD
jgi:hypothetical protein